MPPPRPATQRLMADYRGGDVYHALARLCGLTDDPDPKRWKTAQPRQRQRMKPLQLGINYGMGVPSLARGLDRHPLIASDIITASARTIRASGSGARTWCRARCWSARSRDRRLAAAHHHQPEQAHALQFPDAERRRRDAAAGGQSAVRGRHRADHAGARRHPVRTGHHEQVEHAKEIMRAAGPRFAAASRSASTSTRS